MHLKTLFLENFKNYEKQNFEFVDGINCLVGPNGSGKTNLLDAIHMISVTKSAFNHIDQDLIKEKSDFLRIKASFQNEKENTVEIRLRTGEKKIIFWNDNPYDKLSKHIGKIPLVMISPNDTDLIRQGSEIRRRFFDAMISTVDPDYLKELSDYQRLIRQRNQLLKKMADGRNQNFTLLDVYDDQLIPLNKKIALKRFAVISQFEDDFAGFYTQLSEEKEKIEWMYESNCLESKFEELYLKSRQKDLLLLRTNVGIHKDDIDFTIDGKQVKKFASQGQQKSAVLALKLIQFLMFSKHFKFSPILLLDDIFDKLDSGRMSRLMLIISKQTFRQIFVTDAHPERSIDIFQKADADIRIFEIENGQVKDVK